MATNWNHQETQNQYPKLLMSIHDMAVHANPVPFATAVAFSHYSPHRLQNTKNMGLVGQTKEASIYEL